MSNEYLTALALGTRLRGTHPDQYELIEVLGVGGFGITYRAIDHILGGEVAIKEYFPNEWAVRRGDTLTVSPRTSDESESYKTGLERFLEEARTLVRFKDEPNIVRVVNFIEDHGTAYIVMDYVEGESLADYLKRIESSGGRLNEAQIKQIIIPILDGLRVVHDQGFLHQDIKPANIYIRKDGRPVLLDFGGAREALGEKSRSVSRVLTEGYAPYEQYSGKRSVATDLYAVGATLYRCITGQSPIPSLERSNALLEGEKDPLNRLALQQLQGYSNSLLDMVDKLLAFRARDRPESIENVLKGLLSAGKTEAAPKPEPIPAEKPKVAPRPVPKATQTEVSVAPVKKSRGGLIFSVFLVVVVVLGCIVHFQQNPGFSSFFNDSKVLTYGEEAYEQAQQQYLYQGNNLLAFESYKKAADLGNPLAQAALAKLYQQGWGTTKNKLRAEEYGAKSFDILTKLADQGNADAAYSLAYFYNYGIHVPKNINRALSLYKVAAEQGHAAALNNLASIYRTGDGVDKDINIAIEYYKQAINKNFPLAIVNYGGMFSNGEGVPKNEKTAANWYRKAADLGYAVALTEMGVMYEFGRGVSKNYKKAVEWYKKAAKQNYPRAQANLATMFYNGNGVQKDYNQALMWYTKAAELEYARAQYMVGSMYEYGTGIKKDLKLAVTFYKKAEKQNYAAAQSQLGRLHLLGEGVDRNLVTATRLFKKAADQGLDVGQHNYAVALENGWGTVKDAKEAIVWYKKAAKQGNERSKKRLKELGVKI